MTSVVRPIHQKSVWKDTKGHSINRLQRYKTFWGVTVLFNLREKVNSWLLIPLTDQVLGLMIKKRRNIIMIDFRGRTYDPLVRTWSMPEWGSSLVIDDHCRCHRYSHTLLHIFLSSTNQLVFNCSIILFFSTNESFYFHLLFLSSLLNFAKSFLPWGQTRLTLFPNMLSSNMI